MRFSAHLRGMVRAAGFITWTLSVGGLWCAVRWALPAARRSAGGAWVLHAWSRGLCALLGVRVATRGSLRAGPLLVAANHVGYLDVIVLASVRPSLFVSKSDLAGWPVMGTLAASVGTLFLERARPRSVVEVSEGMRDLFARSQRLIIFPEGTTTEGRAVGPFHSALFEPALQAGAAVQGALLTYAPRSALDPADMAAWTGDAAFVPHLYRLFCGRGLGVRAIFQDEIATHEDRRAAAAAVRGWMAEMLEGMERTAPSTLRNADAEALKKHANRTAAKPSRSRSRGRAFR